MLTKVLVCECMLILLLNIFKDISLSINFNNEKRRCNSR